MTAWSEYQEEVARFFRGLGMDAETNAALQGIRTSHDVDVLVRTKVYGIDVLWLVECKDWKARVPKEKVLVLRTIVQDTGADRGFLMAEGGYQSGALEAAREANVVLTSLADLRETASYDLGMAKLRALHIRNDRARQRYWSMEKGHRIEFGLRPDGGAYGFSADQVMNGIDAALIAAFMYGFPTRHSPGRPSIVAITGYQGISQGEEGEVAGTPMELYGLLAAELAEVEGRLDVAEMAVRRDT